VAASNHSLVFTVASVRLFCCKRTTNGRKSFSFRISRLHFEIDNNLQYNKVVTSLTSELKNTGKKRPSIHSFIVYCIGQQIKSNYSLPFRNYLPHSLLPNMFCSCALGVCKKYRFTFDQLCRRQAKSLYNFLLYQTWIVQISTCPTPKLEGFFQGGGRATVGFSKWWP